MPAPTPPSTPSAVPDTPDRTEGQDTFNTKAFAFNDWFAPFQAWLETVLDYIVDAIAWVEDRATAASTSATSAANSATGAANSANFKGTWSSLTGALNKPAQVLHNGAYWQLLNNLANVTTSEPSPSNADWAFSSGTRWLPAYTSSANIVPNSYSPVQATSTPVNMTLVAMTTGDFVVVQNSPISTQAVTIVNTIYTIRGSAVSISSGTDITLNAGDTAHFRVVSSTILEAVEHA